MDKELLWNRWNVIQYLKNYILWNVRPKEFLWSDRPKQLLWNVRPKELFWIVRPKELLLDIIPKLWNFRPK